MVRAITIAFILLLLSVPASAQKAPPVYVPLFGRGSDAEVKKMIQEALDRALQDQVASLFSVWMKSGEAKGQPERAARGIRKAVAAYRHAIRSVDTEHLTEEPRTGP